MRAIPLTLTAVAAALLLTACDSGGGGSASGKSGDACEIGGVSVQVGSASVAPAAGDTGEVPVSITNSSATCTLDHFPGVTLHQDGLAPKLGPQQGAKAQKLRLAKGDSASFTITYVRGKDGDAKALKAKSMNVTLPGTDVTENFPWRYGPIAGTSGKGEPNASVTAFQSAGD
ncbi:DUF4232 domain-containing protein [Streptomyces sp. NPDC047028]|uniref:DUF4232 domain-containing protein n=1 Tax=Streptomyces sp. NPDC047028 TaxID=3155793 RepID=UPI003408F443